MTKQELHAQYGPKLIARCPGPRPRLPSRLTTAHLTQLYPLLSAGGKRGRGCRVEDVDGNEFLDFAAGIAVASTGHCT